MKKIGLFVAGVLFGIAGIKLLGSRDAKKVYAHTIAAALTQAGLPVTYSQLASAMRSRLLQVSGRRFPDSLACFAQAAGAAAQLLGGTPMQVEYAAEMGFEHNLGLTCDPVGGYVQIPCIERNAFISQKARECAVYSLFSDGRHKVSFDDVVETMMQTGYDMQAKYRETSLGGLARVYRAPLNRAGKADINQ